MLATVLTTTQYDAVYNSLSFMIAAMGATFIAVAAIPPAGVTLKDRHF